MTATHFFGCGSIIATILYCSFFNGSLLFAQENRSIELLWPFKEYRTISSAFGEYRPGHVHMGIDIRVGGVIGIPVLAVADGYISRIKVKPDGYGRAIYLTLNDGRIAVYAHMDSFEPAVEWYVLEKQWESRSFTQDLYPPPDMFRFKRGETIAFSGRSGTKHPHLHFEMRERSDIALNPLSQGLSIKDNRAPEIKSVGIVPLSSDCEVDGDCRPLTFAAVKLKAKRYTIHKKPKIYGQVGFVVSCADYTNDAPRPVSPYRIVFSLDGEDKFSARFDSCDYYSYLQIEVDRDPYLQRKREGRFHRLFKVEGNEMPFYTGDGVIDTRCYEPGVHHMAIIVEDYNGNRSEIEFEVDFIAEPTIPPPIALNVFHNNWVGKKKSAAPPSDYLVEFFGDWLRIEVEGELGGLYWLNGGEFEITFNHLPERCVGRFVLTPEAVGWNFLYSSEFGVLGKWFIGMVTPGSGGVIVSPDRSFRVVFPPDGVYETMYCAIQPVEIDELPAGFEYAARLGYRLDPQWMPLKRRASLRWNIEDTTSQAGVYYIDREKGPTFLGNRRESVEIMGECLNLETFAAIYDREPPEVRIIWPRPGKVLRNLQPKFKFGVEDMLSGIEQESIEVMVDGEWVLAEYDPPRDAVYARLRHPLSPGRREITLTVSDRSGNISAKTWFVILE